MAKEEKKQQQAVEQQGKDKIQAQSEATVEQGEIAEKEGLTEERQGESTAIQWEQADEWEISASEQPSAGEADAPVAESSSMQGEIVFEGQGTDEEAEALETSKPFVEEVVDVLAASDASVEAQSDPAAELSDERMAREATSESEEQAEQATLGAATNAATADLAPRGPLNIKKLAIVASIAMVVGIVSMVFLFPFIMGGTPQEIRQAQASVASLYQSEKRQYLATDVDEQRLAQVKAQLDGLNGLAKGWLIGDWEQAANAYQAIQALNQIYDGDALLIKGEQLPDSLSLRGDVTPEKITALKESETVKKLKADKGVTKTIQALIGHAEQVLAQIDPLKAEIAQLSLNDSYEESQVLANMDKIQAIEKQLRPFGELPAGKELLKALQNKIKPFTQLLVDNAERASYQENTLTRLMSSTAVSPSLVNTPLDTRRLISLTFDDGPNPDHTENLLAVLRKHGVKATFFLVGGWVEQYPDIVRKIRDEGHQIGNHSYTHPDLATLTDEKIKDQIRFCNEVIQEAAGVTPTLYRMPFGSGGERVVNLIPNMTSIIWNVDSADWQSHDKDKIMETVLVNLQPRTTLLMHDTHHSTVEAVDELIPILKEKGYQFVMPQENDLGVYWY